MNKITKLVMAVGFSLSLSANADITTYTYQGNLFSGDYAGVSGSYTPTNAITIQFTTEDVLGYLPTYSAVTNLLTWSISDGIVTDTGTSSSANLTLWVVTDESGTITQWQFKDDLSLEYGIQSINAPYLGWVMDQTSTSSGSGYIAYSPGTWNTTAVPEPNGLFLLGNGLVAILISLRHRK